MYGIEFCVTNDLRHFPIGGLYKTPNLFEWVDPAKDPVASIEEKQRSDINQPSSNIPPWKKKKLKDLREIRDFIMKRKKREIFSYLFDVSLKKKRRRSRWYRDRHSFYGLVRPALHGSGAGRRDKRLFSYFLSFLFIRERLSPFNLKKFLLINIVI